MQVKRFLNKLLSKQAFKKMKMLSNNKIKIIMTKNLENKNYIKHIDVMHYYIQNLVKYR